MTVMCAVFTILLVVGASVAQAQQATAPASATNYTWHAELVSFDQNGKTVTLKTMVVATDAANQIKTFKAGDRVLLQWSGFDTSASGIRGFMKYDAAAAGKEPFLLPVEVATPSVDNSYVTFKLRVPDSAATTLQALKPGEWVTITSKHRPSSDADAVTAVRPYVQSDQKS